MADKTNHRLIASNDAPSNKFGFDRIHLANYDPPKVDVLKTKGNIAQFGTDNNYPKHTIRQFENSPTHGAIVRSIATYIAGKGFQFEGAEESWVTRLGESQSIDRLGKRWALDLKLHNGFVVKVTWAKDGKTIARLGYEDFSFVRKLMDKDRENVVGYLCSREWKQGTSATTKGVVQYPPFDPKKVVAKQTDSKGNPIKDSQGNPIDALTPEGLPIIAEPIQMFYYDGVTAAMLDYPKPQHIQADTAIQLDCILNESSMNDVLNGGFPNVIIEWHGPEPETEDEKDYIRSSFDRSFSGTKGKKSLMAWTDTSEGSKITVHQLDNRKNDGRHAEAKRLAIQEIITAHRLTSPMLAGIPGSGSLSGNASELEAAFNLIDQTVVLEYQDNLVEGLQQIFDTAGMNITVGIIRMNPFQISQAADSTMNGNDGAK